MHKPLFCCVTALHHHNHHPYQCCIWSAFILVALTQFPGTALDGKEGEVLRNRHLGQTAVCDLSKHDEERRKF